MIHNTLITDKNPGNDTAINFHLAPPITLISLNNVTFPNTQKLSFEFKDMTHDHLIQKSKPMAINAKTLNLALYRHVMHQHAMKSISPLAPSPPVQKLHSQVPIPPVQKRPLRIHSL